MQDLCNGRALWWESADRAFATISPFSAWMVLVIETLSSATESHVYKERDTGKGAVEARSQKDLAKLDHAAESAWKLARAFPDWQTSYRSGSFYSGVGVPR